MTPADLRAAVALGLSPSDQGTDTRLTRSNDVTDETEALKRFKLVHDPEFQSQMLRRADGKWTPYDEAAALIRAKDAEIARLMAERDEWHRVANKAAAVLARVEDARLAAEKRVGDASAAWEDFKASSTSQDHYAAVARLDAALTKEKPHE